MTYAAKGLKSQETRFRMSESARLRWANTPPSPRQLEVLRLAADGCTNKRIGRVLGITAGVAADHLRRARRRLGAATVRDAAKIARERGLM